MRYKLLLIVGLLALVPQVALGQQAFAIFNNYDLDATAYTYCNSASIPSQIPVCVTTAQAATDGWFVVSNEEQRTIQVSIDQIVVTGGIDVTIEGRVTGASSIVTIWTDNVTTADTDNDIIAVPENVQELRVGIKIGTSDDGGDLTTNLEIIDIHYAGTRISRR